MSTQSTANATLKALLTCLVDQQQSQQAQLNAIKDTFKANKDEGAVFEGDADDMPRFLPMLRNWAIEQKALRIKEGADVTPKDVGKLDHRKTIQSALSFCEGGKDSYWAANYLKQVNTSMTNASVVFPFEGKWETFEKKFKVCFGAPTRRWSPSGRAKKGLSNTNLMICFQSGLNPEVKKLLVKMDLAQGDPKDLDDLEDHSCRTERALEAEGFSTQKHIEITTTTISATQTTPAGGNGKTCEDFMRFMHNHCYSCGATDHTKAQGNHGEEQCHHCKCLRHCTSVCQDKFVGRMPGLGLKPVQIQKINSTVPFTLFSGETVDIGTS
ncbi:hypothetical protein PQX77_015125 [Marasmius sp. AFHP31]|nr:hypothetical protein PQX77_015125 [Marasmius sp. AFHP31]